MAYASQGRLDEAILDYDRAIQINPDHAAIYYNRGIIYYRQGKLDEAFSDYNKAIQIDSDYVEVSGNQGIQSLIEAQR